MKICACCRLEKDSLHFHRKAKSSDGLHNYCKSCTQIKNALWVKENKEKQAKSCKLWYEKNKVSVNKKQTEWHYKSTYAITYDMFREMASNQRNMCAICSNDLTFEKEKVSSRAVLDHDHITGKLRGVLCNRCNIGIGKFKDDPELIKKAVSYLENPH